MTSPVLHVCLDDSVMVESSQGVNGLPCRYDETRCFHGIPAEGTASYKNCSGNTELDGLTGGMCHGV